MAQAQAVPTLQRVFNVVPLLGLMEWIGPAVGEIAKVVLPPEAVVSPENVGMAVVGGLVMMGASAVREKIERDLTLDPDDPTKPLTWRRIGQKYLLGLLARLG